MDERDIEKLARSITYRRGMDLFLQGNVLEYTFDLEYDIVAGVVCSSDGLREYEVEVVLDEETTDIEDAYCDCEAFASYHGICKHCVALLLHHVHAYGSKHGNSHNKLQSMQGVMRGMKMETPRGFKNLLYGQAEDLTMIQSKSADEEAYEAIIEIEPLLIIGYQEVSVEFRIGQKQKYAIKDIFAFAKRFRDQADYFYGKKLSFVHKKEVLTPQAIRYLEFINRWVEENDSRYETYAYEYDRNGDFRRVLTHYTMKRIALTERGILRLLDANSSNEIIVENYDDPKTKYRILRGAIEKSFYLEGVEGGVNLSFDSMKAYNCVDQYIMIDTGIICIMESERLQPILEVVEYCLNYGIKGKVFISNEDLPAFCTTMLPTLRAVLQENSKNFQEISFQLEPVVLKVYLDMVQENMLSIKPVACYGEQEYPVYDTTVDVQRRDSKKEATLGKLVGQYATAYEGDTYAMILYRNDALLYQLLTQGLEQLQEIAEVYCSDSVKALRPRTSPTVQIGVAVQGSVLSLDVSLDHITMDEMIELLSKYDKKKKYHRLKSGAFIQIDHTGIEEFAQLRDVLSLSDKELRKQQIEIPVFRSFYIDELLRKNQAIHYTKNSEFKKLIRSMKTVEDDDVTISKEWEMILRQYQITGYAWMKTLKQNQLGGILADDMGLGKTVQVIAFLSSELREPEAGSVLIVTPASLVYNWNAEFHKFAPDLRVSMVVGTQAERQSIIGTIENGQVLITSYDLLKRDIFLYEEKEFAIQIIDEAQFIKNSNTQATKAVKAIRSQFRLALTGTPVENRLSELWSIFDYTMPGFLYSATKFQKELEGPIVKQQNQEALERLKKMVTPFILRRKKQDVLKDLPDKVEENRIVLLEKEQQKLYDAHVKRLQLTIGSKSKEEFQTSKIQILAELTKLRQICCEPRLFLEKYEKESAKLELCMEMIQNAVEGNHKILLFSQFTTMFEYIGKRLEQAGIAYYTLTGATSKEKRASMVQSFNQDDTPVFCISLKAGGTGLNLTAADIVIHYDPWWNVAVQDQATDRAHRIGQKQVVTVYKLIAKGTIEEKIIQLQERKKELADQILEGEGVATAGFSKEELLELLA